MAIGFAELLLARVGPYGHCSQQGSGEGSKGSPQLVGTHSDRHLGQRILWLFSKSWTARSPQNWDIIGHRLGLCQDSAQDPKGQRIQPGSQNRGHGLSSGRETETPPSSIPQSSSSWALEVTGARPTVCLPLALQCLAPAATWILGFPAARAHQGPQLLPGRQWHGQRHCPLPPVVIGLPAVGTRVCPGRAGSAESETWRGPLPGGRGLAA